jgi:FkbM family methyltransferase
MSPVGRSSGTGARGRLKAVLNGIAARFGAEIIRSNPDPRSQLMRDTGTALVLDVGAFVGEYGRQLRSAGYRERIVSFEPQTRAFDALRENASGDPAWECRRLALANRSEQATLKVADRAEASSLLTLDRDHVAANPEWTLAGEELVTVATLDSLRRELIRADDRVLLKIDAQGSELDVLRGAEQTLDGHVDLIEVELSLAPIYQGQPLLPEVTTYLYEKGFRLVWLERILVDRRTRLLLQVDALFKRVTPT